MSGQSMYPQTTPATPSRDPGRGFQDQARNPSPITGDRSTLYNGSGRPQDFNVSPGSTVVVTKRLVEPDRSYLETLKKTIEDNMREEQRLRQEKDQLIRENQMLQQQLSVNQMASQGDPSYESNLQRNLLLKNEISDLQRRLERERENQKKSLSFQEQRLREYEDKIRHYELENTQLKGHLQDGSGKEQQLRSLTQENQRLKEELFRSGDGARIDTVRVVQENATLKARVSELEKDLQAALLEKDRLEKSSQTANKSDKLMRELRRLNDDNVTLYDDNKLLMRQNNQLKADLEDLRRGSGLAASGVSLEQTEKKKLQDSVSALYQENRSLSSELSSLKLRLQSDMKPADQEAQVARLRAELAARERELQDLAVRLPRLESDHKSLQAELRATTQAMQEQADKIRILTMNLNQREEDLRRASQQAGPSPQLQQMLKARDEEIAALTRLKFDLESRAASLDGENRVLKSSAEGLKSQVGTMIQAQNGAAQENSALRKRVGDLEFEREELKRRAAMPQAQAPDEGLLRQKDFLEKELDRKVQREKRIETELTKLRNEVELLIEERDTFKKKYKESDTARDMVTALERENADLRRRAQDSSQVAELANELRSRDRTIAELSAQLQRAARELEAAREQPRLLASDPSGTKELENKINYLMGENSKLRYDLENHQKIEDGSYKNKYLIDDLNRKLSNLEIEKARMEQTLLTKNADIRNLEDSRKYDREEIDSLKLASKRTQDRVAQLEAEKAQLLRSSIREDTVTNQAQVESLRNENKSLNERLNAARDDALRTREELQAKEALLSKSSLELQKKDFEVKSAAFERDRLQNEVAQLNLMKERLKDASVSEDRLNNMRNEINSLREKTINLERANLEKETEIANLRRGGENYYVSEKDMQSGAKLIYQTQLLEHKQEISILEGKINLMKQENENLARVAKERQTELEKIKVDMLTKGDIQAEELTRLRKQFEAYVRQHYDIQELTARHEIEIRKYQNKVSELLQTITQLQDKNKELRQTLNQKSVYIDTLEKSNEERLKNETGLQRQSEQLKREKEELVSQLNKK